MPAGASPGASRPILPGEPNPPWDDGALPAVIDPTLVNAHPRTWSHVLVAPDGRTLDVYFWNGAPECAGLARVDGKAQPVGSEQAGGDLVTGQDGREQLCQGRRRWRDCVLRMPAARLLAPKLRLSSPPFPLP